jgi:hypothetical protein
VVGAAGIAARFRRTQRVMRFAVNGFISSTTRAHVSALWVSSHKIYFGHATRPTCALLHRNKHATASGAGSRLWLSGELR